MFCTHIILFQRFHIQLSLSSMEQVLNTTLIRFTITVNEYATTRAEPKEHNEAEHQSSLVNYCARF